jgi:hypothetical protein
LLHYFSSPASRKYFLNEIVNRKLWAVEVVEQESQMDVKVTVAVVQAVVTG